MAAYGETSDVEQPMGPEGMNDLDSASDVEDQDDNENVQGSLEPEADQAMVDASETEAEAEGDTSEGPDSEHATDEDVEDEEDLMVTVTHDTKKVSVDRTRMQSLSPQFDDIFGRDQRTGALPIAVDFVQMWFSYRAFAQFINFFHGRGCPGICEAGTWSPKKTFKTYAELLCKARTFDLATLTTCVVGSIAIWTTGRPPKDDQLQDYHVSTAELGRYVSGDVAQVDQYLSVAVDIAGRLARSEDTTVRAAGEPYVEAISKVLADSSAKISNHRSYPKLDVTLRNLADDVPAFALLVRVQDAHARALRTPASNCRNPGCELLLLGAQAGDLGWRCGDCGWANDILTEPGLQGVDKGGSERRPHGEAESDDEECLFMDPDDGGLDEVDSDDKLA